MIVIIHSTQSLSGFLYVILRVKYSSNMHTLDISHIDNEIHKYMGSLTKGVLILLPYYN